MSVVGLPSTPSTEAGQPVRLSSSGKGALYTTKFNSDASLLAAAGADRAVTVWDVKPDGSPASDEYQFLPAAHKSAVTWLCWSQMVPGRLFTASADSTGAVLDLQKGQKVNTFRHTGCVNQVSVSKRDFVASCSDDGTVRLWDVRFKSAVATITTDFPVLTCCIDPSEQGVFFAGVNPTVHCYDPRNTSKPLWEECSQTDNVTSLSLSPGPMPEYLLSKSIDGTIKYFDCRFSATPKKRAKPYVFDGCSSSREDYLVRAQLITKNDKLTVVSGSNDGFAYVWDFASRKLVSRLAGHSGCLYDTDYCNGLFATCSQDGTLILRPSL